MNKFKCSVCGCEKAHSMKRLFKDKDVKIIEDIIQIKSFMADNLIILRACSSCGTIKANWEKISESKNTTQEEKNKVKEVQGKYTRGDYGFSTHQ